MSPWSIAKVRNALSTRRAYKAALAECTEARRNTDDAHSAREKVRNTQNMLEFGGDQFSDQHRIEYHKTIDNFKIAQAAEDLASKELARVISLRWWNGVARLCRWLMAGLVAGLMIAIAVVVVDWTGSTGWKMPAGNVPYIVVVAYGIAWLTIGIKTRHVLGVVSCGHYDFETGMLKYRPVGIVFRWTKVTELGSHRRTIRKEGKEATVEVGDGKTRQTLKIVWFPFGDPAHNSSLMRFCGCVALCGLVIAETATTIHLDLLEFASVTDGQQLIRIEQKFLISRNGTRKRNGR